MGQGKGEGFDNGTYLYLALFMYDSSQKDLGFYFVCLISVNPIQNSASERGLTTAEASWEKKEREKLR